MSGSSDKQTWDLISEPADGSQAHSVAVLSENHQRLDFLVFNYCPITMQVLKMKFSGSFLLQVD